MTDDPTGTRPKLELNGVQVLGGALAATTSAVAASALGVAGTLAGAAIGSAVAAVGASLYTYSLRRTSQTVITAIRKTPGGTVVETTTGASPGPAAPRLKRRAAPRWAPVGAAAAAFALAMGAVSAAELVVGEPLATAVYGQPASSGTTVGAALSEQPDVSDEPDEPEVGTAPGTPEASPSPEAVPSATPDGEEPTDQPTGPDGEPAEDVDPTRTERVEVAPNRDPSSDPKVPAADAVPAASPAAG